MRSAYQTGKSPVLPIYAAGLGAGDALLGFIVAVSTISGLVLKPVVGFAADRWGHRRLLLIGTLLFVGVPGLYVLVDSPGELVAVRLVHGLATAIYGPVTVAWVAGLAARRTAERLGWFGMARTAGYVVGPAAGGVLLGVLPPSGIYLVIGLVSALALVPVLWLGAGPATAWPVRPGVGRQVGDALRAAGRAPAIAVAAGLQGTLFVATYALKTFLPLHAVAVGLGAAWAGTLMSLQAGVQMGLNPLGGWLADRWGRRVAVAVGLVVVGAALMAVPWLFGWALPVAFVLAGAGEAVLAPATAAWIAEQVEPSHRAAGMGLAQALQNAGKVLGPVVGGVLVAASDFAGAMAVLGGVLVVGGAVVAVVTGGGRWGGGAGRRGGGASVRLRS